MFTDVDMPGSMNSVTQAEPVSQNWPDIWLVLTFGRHRFSAGEVPDHSPFVPKPYQASQVNDAIHHAE